MPSSMPFLTLAKKASSVLPPTMATVPPAMATVALVARTAADSMNFSVVFIVVSS